MEHRNYEFGAQGLAPLLRYAEHVAELPVIETFTAQLGRGDARLESQRVCGKDMILLRLRVDPRLAGYAVPDPDWLCVMVPLRWRGEYKFNGLIAERNDVFLSGGPSGYATTGEGRDTIVIGMRRSRLERTIRALTGNTDTPIHFVDGRLALGDDLGPRFHRLLGEVMSGSAALSLPGNRFLLSESVENDLFDRLGLLLNGFAQIIRPRDPVRKSALSIVTASLEGISLTAPNLPSLTDLCEASGVGMAWLHRCFVDIYGCPPYELLRAYRLTCARERLLDRHNRISLVKEVAFSFGFRNTGRFSADYRARFGENPSDTLLVRLPDRAEI